MTREEAIKILKAIRVYECYPKSASEETKEAIDMAIEALSAETVPQSEQYKKGFDDAKRAFLVEYARESENMRKRIAQLEVMLNAQKAISAEARPTVEWIDEDGNNVPLNEDGYPLRSCYCNQCYEWLVGSDEYETKGNFCPNCGAKMKDGDEE